MIRCYCWHYTNRLRSKLRLVPRHTQHSVDIPSSSLPLQNIKHILSIILIFFNILIFYSNKAWPFQYPFGNTLMLQLIILRTKIRYSVYYKYLEGRLRHFFFSKAKGKVTKASQIQAGTAIHEDVTFCGLKAGKGVFGDTRVAFYSPNYTETHCQCIPVEAG